MSTHERREETNIQTTWAAEAAPAKSVALYFGDRPINWWQTTLLAHLIGHH